MQCRNRIIIRACNVCRIKGIMRAVSRKKELVLRSKFQIFVFHVILLTLYFANLQTVYICGCRRKCLCQSKYLPLDKVR